MLSYEGNEKYGYVSYCREDEGAVCGYINILQIYGYRLKFGSESSAADIAGAESLIIFVTKKALKTKSITAEVKCAKANRVPIILIYIEKAALLRLGMISPNIKSIDISGDISAEKACAMITPQLPEAINEKYSVKDEGEKEHEAFSEAYNLEKEPDYDAYISKESSEPAEESADGTHVLSADELFVIGLKCYYGYGGKKPDYKNAIRHFFLSARLGNARAKLYMGKCSELGHGVGKSGKQAAELYKMSADMGCADAMLILGYTYEKGNLGESVNIVKACEWYKKAADAGNAPAMYHLALLVRDIDSGESDEYIIKAAEAGYTLAQYTFGVMCLMTEKYRSRDKAELWLTRAAEGGNADAKRMLETLGSI